MEKLILIIMSLMPKLYESNNIEINISVFNGSKKFSAYTMDFTKKYIEINSDYRS